MINENFTTNLSIFNMKKQIAQKKSGNVSRKLELLAKEKRNKSKQQSEEKYENNPEYLKTKNEIAVTNKKLKIATLTDQSNKRMMQNNKGKIQAAQEEIELTAEFDLYSSYDREFHEQAIEAIHKEYIAEEMKLVSLQIDGVWK